MNTDLKRRRSSYLFLRLTLIALIMAYIWPTGLLTNVQLAAIGCGYFVDPVSSVALYTHCNERTHVVIIVEYRVGSTERCVGPGETKLGTTDLVRNAYYAGRTC